MREDETIIYLWGFDDRKDTTPETGAKSHQSMQRAAVWPSRRGLPDRRASVKDTEITG
jgi:hypothetical protein